jgi:hypothetical protein
MASFSVRPPGEADRETVRRFVTMHCTVVDGDFRVTVVRSTSRRVTVS